MGPLKCIVAETQRQLDDSLRVRFEVFARELGYLDTNAHTVPREIDAFDTLPTTFHIVAYKDGEAVGSMRILLPNPEIAKKNGTVFGLDLESKFDLSPLARFDLRIAETTRFCVLASRRATGAAAALHAAAVYLSQVLGITHWIGSANTETDASEDVSLIRRAAEQLGLVRQDVHIAPRFTKEAPTSPRFPFYDQISREFARDNPASASLPGTLALYTRRMHARIVGPAIFEPRFGMFSMPILAAVADQRTSVRRNSATIEVPRQIAA